MESFIFPYFRLASFCVIVVALVVGYYILTNVVGHDRTDDRTDLPSIKIMNMSDEHLELIRTTPACKTTEQCSNAKFMINEIMRVHDDNPQGYHKELQLQRDALIEPSTENVPTVVERVVLNGEYEYVIRFHKNAFYVNKSLARVQLAINEMCPSQTCILKDIYTTVFDNTDVERRSWIMLEHHWFDSETTAVVLKRSLFKRVSNTTIVGYGFSVEQDIPRPVDRYGVGICMGIYASFLMVGFVFPATFLVSGYNFFHDNRFILYALPSIVLLLFVGLLSSHLVNIRTTSSLTYDNLRERINTRRIIAVTIAAMALSFAFFAVSKEALYIIPSMLLSVVYGMLLIVDINGVHISNEYTNDGFLSLMRKDHVNATLLVCSTFSLIWLFLLYLCRYSLKGLSSNLSSNLSR